jgi:flavin reductase (DIM6/NTAB) family NADH-FMN oxidoreductase RutF
MKEKLRKPSHVFPLPVTIVGALVDGKPNFITLAWNGVVDYGVLSISVGKTRHTLKGIQQTGVFSVNIPSTNLIAETDYCGSVSGKDVDKSRVFKVFYGELKDAPMIEECPVTMECKVLHSYDYPTHYLFAGEIVATYAERDIFTGDTIDPRKLCPFFFTTTDMSYYHLGERIARGWEPGKKYKK